MRMARRRLVFHGWEWHQGGASPGVSSCGRCDWELGAMKEKRTTMRSAEPSPPRAGPLPTAWPKTENELLDVIRKELDTVHWPKREDGEIDFGSKAAGDAYNASAESMWKIAVAAF